jgi:hypothetical protein
LVVLGRRVVHVMDGVTPHAPAGHGVVGIALGKLYPRHHVLVKSDK